MPTELVSECRQAAECLRATGTFQSGQGILLDAADEIERLRAEVTAWRERFPVAGYDGSSVVLSG